MAAWNWIVANWVSLIAGWGALITLAGVIVKFTKTPSDDEVVAKIKTISYKIIETLAGKVK